MIRLIKIGKQDVLIDSTTGKLAPVPNEPFVVSETDSDGIVGLYGESDGEDLWDSLIWYEKSVYFSYPTSNKYGPPSNLSND